MNFFWSPLPTKRSTKNPQKFRGKFGAKFGAKFGTRFRKIRGTFVLRLFWPNERPSFFFFFFAGGRGGNGETGSGSENFSGLLSTNHINIRTRGARQIRLPSLGISLAIYIQELKGLSVGNSQKSLKRGSRGLSAPKSKKARKRVENDYFSSFFSGFLAFRLVFDFFGGYVDPGAESPRQPLFRLFSEFSREKAVDSCRWPTISQPLPRNPSHP